MRSTFIATVACVLLASGSAPAQSLQEEINATAKQVAEVVKAKGGALAFGEVGDVSGSGSNSGPGLLNLLAPLLVKEGVRIDDKAALLLQGNYGAKVADGLLRVRLELRIVDRSGEELVTLPKRFEVPVLQNAEIAVLLGLTVHLPPAAPGKDRNENIEKARKKESTPAVQKTVVRTHPESPYGVEIRVKPAVKAEAKPKEAELKDGVPFVEIGLGELYEISLVNDSAHEAAVRIAIDGLDVFTFSEDRKADGKARFTHFILPAKKTTVIKGWHRTNKDLPEGNIWSFLVTEYGKGADSAKKSSGKVGVVSVTFSVSYLSEEELKNAEGKARDVRKETDRGPLDREKFQAVKRFIGIERDVVSVRYSR